MGTRQSEWLAAIKPILEKEEAKKDAEELARELRDILKIDMDINPENLKQLTDEFNKQLLMIGKQPIVFSETTLQGIVGQFANAIVGGITKGVSGVGSINLDPIGDEIGNKIGKGFNDGITNGVSDGSKNIEAQLEAEFNQLLQTSSQKIQELDKLRSKIGRKEIVADKLQFSPYTQDSVQVDDNFSEYATNVITMQDDANERLEQAIEDGKVTEKLLKEWVSAAQKYRDVYQTVNGMDQSRAKNLLGSDYKYFTDDAYEANTETGLDTIDEFVDTDELLNSVDIVEQELEKLQIKINNILQEHPEFISEKEAFEATNRLQQIQQAYERLNKKKTGAESIDKIEKSLNYKGAGTEISEMPKKSALNTYDDGYKREQEQYNGQLKKHAETYERAKKALERAFQAYDNSAGKSWEERYRLLIKAGEEFESIENNPNVSEKDKEDILGGYRDTFEGEIKPTQDIAREMLQDIVNLRDGKALITAKTSAKEDGVTPGAEDVANAQKLTRETENKAEAETRVEESLKKQKIEAEGIAEANREVTTETADDKRSGSASTDSIGDASSDDNIEDSYDRIRQNATAAEQAVDSLNDSIEETKNATQNADSGVGTITSDASSAGLEAAQKQIAELQEQKNREIAAKDAELTQIRETGAAQLEAVNNEKVTLQNDLDVARQQVQLTQNEETVSQVREAEANQRLAEQEAITQQLREQLASVQTGGEKVNMSVGAEDLKRILNEVVYRVQITSSDTDKNANKIILDEDESNQETGSWALEETLLNVKEILGQIQANTAQKQFYGTSSANIEGGSVLATEGTLAAIQATIESINSRLVKETGVQNITDSESGPKNVQKQFNDSVSRGQYTEENKQHETSAEQYDKDDATRLKNIVSLEKEIGRLRAEQDVAPNESVKNSIEEEISLRQELIELRQQGLTMDAEVEAYQKKRLANQTKEAKDRVNQERTERKGVFEDAKKSAQKDAMLGKTNNAVSRAETTWMNAGDISVDASPETNALLDQYYQKIIALRQEKEKLAKSESIDPADKDSVIQHTQDLNRMTAEVQKLVQEYQSLSGDNSMVIGNNTLDSSASINAYKEQLTHAVQAATNGAAHITGFDASTKTLTYSVKEGSHEFTEYTATVRGADNALVSLRGTTKKTETFFEATKRKLAEISSYMSGMMILSRVRQEFQKGIQYIKEIDSALTELKKVTNETAETYEEFVKTAAKTANKLGSTMQEVISSTADFARLGYSLKDASTMAESAQILMNVSEFTDISAATDTLISAMQANDCLYVWKHAYSTHLNPVTPKALLLQCG